MKPNYECVIAIVNHGYSDLVMEAAKRSGAKGGTILAGRGTGNKDIQDFFGVTVTPEKDIVLILVPKEIRDQVIASINEGAGMSTKGMGVAFSLPVGDVVGIDTEALSKGQE